MSSFKNLHGRIYANCYLCLFRGKPKCRPRKGTCWSAVSRSNHWAMHPDATWLLLLSITGPQPSTRHSLASCGFGAKVARERDLRVIRKVRPLPHSDFTLLIPLYDYHPTPALLAFVPPPWPQVELWFHNARSCKEVCKAKKNLFPVRKLFRLPDPLRPLGTSPVPTANVQVPVMRL